MPAGKALRQLHQPSRNHPCYITNISPDPDAVNFALPKSLTDNRLRRCHIFTFGINVTPKFTDIDLHVDNGMGVVSAGVSTTKIWFLYPPTVCMPFRSVARFWARGSMANNVHYAGQEP